MSPPETRLLALTLAASCCWFCRALCQPRSVPLVPPATAQPYLQSFGRQRRLTILATLLSVAAVIAVLALPPRFHPDMQALRRAAASCAYLAASLSDHWEDSSAAVAPTCYALEPGGVWVLEELRHDGTWTAVDAALLEAALDLGPVTSGVCTTQANGTPACYQLHAEGLWTRQAQQGDGTWLTVGLVIPRTEGT